MREKRIELFFFKATIDVNPKQQQQQKTHSLSYIIISSFSRECARVGQPQTTLSSTASEHASINMHYSHSLVLLVYRALSQIVYKPEQEGNTHIYRRRRSNTTRSQRARALTLDSLFVSLVLLSGTSESHSLDKSSLDGSP